MSIRPPWGAAAAIGLLLVSASHAQPVTSPVRPDPLDAKAEVAPVTYASALGRYRPAGDVKVGSWRDANDTVTRIGGWRAYTREANQPEAAPTVRPAAPASAPAPAPAAAAHGHHGKP